MSAADDFIDDMIDRDERVLDRIASLGVRTNSGNRPAHGLPHARRRRGSPGTKERFDRFFRRDGGASEREVWKGGCQPATMMGRSTILDLLERLPSSDWLPGEIMEPPKEPPSERIGGRYASFGTWHEALKAVFEGEPKRRAAHGIRWRRETTMGKKQRRTAATVRDAMTVRHRLMRQREQYRETRDEVRAAYAKGAADMRRRAVRPAGERLGPAPMPPCLPEGADYDLPEFRARHDPDDRRQRDDVPKELADCERRRAAGRWTPCRADDRDVPCPVDRPAETGA